MRLPIPASSPPLHMVNPSFQAPAVIPLTSLSYAIPRIRKVVPRLALIVARIGLLVVLGIVVHDIAAMLIEHYRWQASTAMNDDALRACVQQAVARGDPPPREAGETEEEFLDRCARFDRMCDRTGVARVQR